MWRSGVSGSNRLFLLHISTNGAKFTETVYFILLLLLLLFGLMRFIFISYITDMLLSCSSMLLQPFMALLDCFSFSDFSQGATFSSNCTWNYKYDVFISFRGPTHNYFVDHLYAHLTKKGLFVFKDDKRLEKGKSLSAQLLQAIENSRTSIVVFSKKYADSTWCLEEMAAISECADKFQQKVFPVFYDIDPSDVRKQSGAYRSAFFFFPQYEIKSWSR